MLHLMKRFAHMAPATQPVRPSRRTFLKMSAGAAGGLMIGLKLPVNGAVAAETGAASGAGEMFTPFVRIAPDGIVTVLNKHLDMGQGNATGLATLVAGTGCGGRAGARRIRPRRC